MTSASNSIFGPVDAGEFERMTGFPPELDDLDRANCPKSGHVGHMFCGICPPCGKPRFICGHPLVESKHDR